MTLSLRAAVVGTSGLAAFGFAAFTSLPRLAAGVGMLAVANTALWLVHRRSDRGSA